MNVRSDAHRAFGQAVRAIRNSQGLSQEALAFACDLDRTYLSGIERGERNPSLTNIFKIARALKTPPAELFKRTEEAMLS